MIRVIAYPIQAPVKASPPDGWGDPRVARCSSLLPICEYTMQGQKVATQPGDECEVQQLATRAVWANIQVPQSLKHPNKE